MPKKLIVSLSIVALLVATSFIYWHETRAETWETTQVFNDSTTFNGTTNHFASLQVGDQAEGGVTFFNGSITNGTTGEDGSNNPVTFGDDVRIDGAIFRTEAGGDNPVKVVDNIIPTATNVYSLGSDSYRWRDGYFTGTLYVGSINGNGVVSTANLANNAVTGDKIAADSIGGRQITSGGVGTTNLADNAITTDKINTDAVENDKLADDAVDTDNLVDDAVDTDKVAEDAIGRAEISGEGEANLPIAYGICYDNALIADYSTSNVASCTWHAETESYLIEITGETFSILEYVVSITAINGYRTPQTDSVLGKLQVAFTDPDGAKQQSGFSFVIYKR